MDSKNKNSRLIIVLFFIVATIGILLVLDNFSNKDNKKNITDNQKTTKIKAEKITKKELKNQLSDDSKDDESTPLKDDLKNKIKKSIIKTNSTKKEWLEGEILPHKGFEDSLVAINGISLKNAMEISNVLRFNIDFRNLYAGEKFKVKLDKDGNVENFVYMPNIVTFYRLKRNKKTGKLVFSKKTLPTNIKYRTISGTIKTTLNQALIERDDVTPTIRTQTNGAVECLVNLRSSARKGDRYKILVKEKFYKGKKIPGSEVLYVSYNGKATGFKEAFKYDDKDPKSAFNALYSVQGKALISNGLRLPLDRIHVTSPFGIRIHPVTGRRVMHNGVDLGGKIGTPVYAIARGVVVQTTRTRYGGNKIVIRHADGTKSYYLHLHKILVKQGTRVIARQLIGQIGRTGRVTGPHLHLGIKSPRGKWLNPMKVRMIATPKLKGRRLAVFKKEIKHIKKLLGNVETKEKIIKKYNQGPQPQ